MTGPRTIKQRMIAEHQDSIVGLRGFIFDREITIRHNVDAMGGTYNREADLKYIASVDADTTLGTLRDRLAYHEEAMEFLINA